MYICTRDIRDRLKIIKDISSNINVIVLGVCRRHVTGEAAQLHRCERKSKTHSGCQQRKSIYC